MRKKMMVALAGAGALMSGAALAQAPVKEQPTVVHLQSEAEEKVAPDVADIGAGVVTQAADAGAALRANSEQMNRVVAALRKAGIASRDIQTSQLSLQPQYRYEKEQPPQLVAYRATNQVNVTLRDIGQAGRVIDALVAEGANQVDGPNFRIDNPEELLDKARAEAVRKGRARADLYASAAGMRVKRLLSINESGRSAPPVPVARAMMAKAADAEASPIEAGEVGVRVNLSMSFELE